MRGERRMRRCEREIDQTNRDCPFPEFRNPGPKQNQRDDKRRLGSNYLRICLSCFAWVRNFNIGAVITAYSQVVLSGIWHSGL